MEKSSFEVVVILSPLSSSTFSTSALDGILAKFNFPLFLISFNLFIISLYLLYVNSLFPVENKNCFPAPNIFPIPLLSSLFKIPEYSTFTLNSLKFQTKFPLASSSFLNLIESIAKLLVFMYGVTSSSVGVYIISHPPLELALENPITLALGVGGGVGVSSYTKFTTTYPFESLFFTETSKLSSFEFVVDNVFSASFKLEFEYPNLYLPLYS